MTTTASRWYWNGWCCKRLQIGSRWTGAYFCVEMWQSGGRANILLVTKEVAKRMYYGYWQPAASVRNPHADGFTDRNRFLQMLLKAIYDERTAQQFYREMYDRATTMFQKHSIQHAWHDEIKHEKMLIQLYQSLTGTDPQVPYPGPAEIADFERSIEQALEDELTAAEHYREMYKITTIREVRDQLLELTLDEMEHATRFTYIRAAMN